MLGLGLRAKSKKALQNALFAFRNRFGRPELFDLRTPERFGSVFHEPSDMCVPDRIMIYALVRGLRPERALEIGVRWGNSARIIANAMEDNGKGLAVGIDPEVAAFSAAPEHLHGRYRLIEGRSPEAIPQAAKAAGGSFDFVFIDALHIYSAALADFKGVLPSLAPGAHVLFHDAYHQGISAAVCEVLAQNGDLHDCGIISRNPVIGDPVSYQGLRLVRFKPSNPDETIRAGYREAGRAEPAFSKELWNYDAYAIRAGLVPKSF